MLVPVELSRILIREMTDTQFITLKESDGDRSFPIAIGLPEAQAIERRLRNTTVPRPQTHDLLIDIVESLNASISEVCITDIQEKTYFAEITLNTLEGNITLSSRPSDAIALAIRSNSRITVDNELFSNNSIILIDENNEEIQEFKEFIDDISPDDFS